jgi:hypothetical protein
MAIFTSEEVTRAAYSATQVQTRDQFEKHASAYISMEASKERDVRTFDIFLSHPYNDRTIIIGLYGILRGLGFAVYVDWIHDPQLNRQQVTTATAKVLRQRMEQCKSLLYATTVNNTTSRWMPWECGFYDGHDGHVAILPVLSYAATTFTGQEYLGLYPFSQKSNEQGRKALKIHNQMNPYSAVSFDLWIRGVNP